VHEEKCVPKAECLYCGFGRGRELYEERGEMKNKRKYNRNSKVELPKRFRKNKK
jgi:ribosomal protein L37E